MEHLSPTLPLTTLPSIANKNTNVYYQSPCVSFAFIRFFFVFLSFYSIICIFIRFSLFFLMHSYTFTLKIKFLSFFDFFLSFFLCICTYVYHFLVNILIF